MLKHLLAGILLATLLVPGRGAGVMADEEAPDITKLGPQPGDPVPDFTLPDQTGTERTLRSLMGPNGLVLVFFRSADW
jgi:hypothetical protein